MSIIGPRPEDPHFVGLHEAEYEVILSIRPGITGLSQLAYVEESRIVDDDSPIQDYIERIMPQKLTLDKLYARQSSLMLDLSVLRWTVITLILGRPVAVDRTTGSMNVRRREPLPMRCRTATATNGRSEARTSSALTGRRPSQRSIRPALTPGFEPLADQARDLSAVRSPLRLPHHVGDSGPIALRFPARTCSAAPGSEEIARSTMSVRPSSPALKAPSPSRATISGDRRRRAPVSQHLARRVTAHLLRAHHSRQRRQILGRNLGPHRVPI